MATIDHKASSPHSTKALALLSQLAKYLGGVTSWFPLQWKTPVVWQETKILGAPSGRSPWSWLASPTLSACLSVQHSLVCQLKGQCLAPPSILVFSDFKILNTEGLRWFWFYPDAATPSLEGCCGMFHCTDSKDMACDSYGVHSFICQSKKPRSTL